MIKLNCFLLYYIIIVHKLKGIVPFTGSVKYRSDALEKTDGIWISLTSSGSCRIPKIQIQTWVINRIHLNRTIYKNANNFGHCFWVGKKMVLWSHYGEITTGLSRNFRCKLLRSQSFQKGKKNVVGVNLMMQHKTMIP